MTTEGRTSTPHDQREHHADVWHLAGTRPFHCAGEPLPFALGDFWCWAASNLSGNVLRGWVAEFLVSASLGHLGSFRREWDACDLRLSNGRRLEVKCSAYLQSWKQQRLSVPRFDIQGRGGWDAEREVRLPAGTRFAHAYVFALHAHREAKTADVMDVDQWEFWVVPTRDLDGRKSLGVQAVRRLGGEAVGFSGLRQRIEGVLVDISLRE